MYLCKISVKELNNDDQTYSSVIIHLKRKERNTRVGRAYLVFQSESDVLIGDLIVDHQVDFRSWHDKIYKMLHWQEPTNYQRRGLGTIMLKYIINLARRKGIKTLHGSLTEKDMKNNPNLVNWYRKYGFKIEKPTKDEVKTAKFRLVYIL